MKQLLKTIIKKVLHFSSYPLRTFIARKDSETVNISQAIKKIQVPNDLILSQVRQMIQEGHSVTIGVKGYSMRPFLEHTRDKVVLVSFENLTVGDAVLAEIRSGYFVLHRIIVIDGLHLTLMGDGNLSGTESCKITDVAGKVKTYIRKSKAIEADSVALRCYIACWRKCLPIRRYLLYIYRLLNNF